MRRLLVVGIGAGDPEYVTVQAIRALNRTDAFFLVDKGQEKDELAQLRREILDRYVERPGFRVVTIQDPARDRTASAYRSAVDAWRSQRAALYEAALRDNLGEDEVGAFLVWGDPSLYDSTLGIVEEIVARGALALEYEVIPGISSIQALAAKHRIGLNRVGGAVQITTGRRLARGQFAGVGDASDVVVMLDAECSFRQLAEDGVTIYWGAYVGTEDEILISGPLGEVADEIERVRKEARERHGWIMDTYLLRRGNAR